MTKTPGSGRKRLKAARAAEFLALVCSAIVLLVPPAMAQSAPSPLLAAQRAQHLRRGVNLTGWFQAGPNGLTKQHVETTITDQDLALIRAMGFDHVRLPIDPAPMLLHGHADEIPPEYLGYLDEAVQRILSHGLAVELDIHAGEDIKHKLATDNGFAEEVADFWSGLARHFAASDPNLVFFEIMNEPELNDPYRWYGLETAFAARIRAAAPHHTIIATGARWSDDDDLLFLQPLRDPNVIYNFHFYEPHIFTHQGATWSENFFHFLHGVPYPSTPENVHPILDQAPEGSLRLRIARYGMDRWNADRIEADISLVADWAARNGVTVICNEFGAYRKNADPADRAQWLSDVRFALERRHIGWATWSYDGGFGVATRTAGPNAQPGPAVPDPLTIHALGLHLPGPKPSSAH